MRNLGPDTSAQIVLHVFHFGKRADSVGEVSQAAFLHKAKMMGLNVALPWGDSEFCTSSFGSSPRTCVLGWRSLVVSIGGTFPKSQNLVFFHSLFV